MDVDHSNYAAVAVEPHEDYPEDYPEVKHLFERWDEHPPDLDAPADPSVFNADSDEEIFERVGRLNVEDPEHSSNEELRILEGMTAMTLMQTGNLIVLFLFLHALMSISQMKFWTRFAIHPQSTSPHHPDINSVLNMTSPINSVFIHITMFFDTPVPMTPYSDCHPVSFVDHAHATQHLAEQRERARALRYQQQPVSRPTPTALLAQEYNEFPDQQRMMRILSEMQRDRIQEWQDHVALHAHIEEEQGFARRRADAERFLAEAETYLSEFLPPDQEPYLSAFQPFDLPDTPVPTSTSNVLVQDEPLLKDGSKDCVMTENRLMAEYRIVL
ncbi:hypothetical protein EV702DRAFT_1055033, partial [Suillus placidus]